MHNVAMGRLNVGLFAWALATCLQAQSTPPTIQREFRAAWTASVYNIDWPTSRTLTTSQQQTEIRNLLDKLVQLNMNAVFVQVRPQCDAFYNSSQEPWSEYLTNVMGNAPNPFYDPLDYWIQQGRLRGVQVYAWVNPYRAKAGTGTVGTPSHITNSRPDLVQTYGTNKWLDPGHPDAIAYSSFAVMDIVNRYDVDGIVFDDYFYPYPVSGETFDDDATYNTYVGGGGTLSRSDWRRQNVNNFVQNTYTNIKNAKPWVKFGIAPFGIWRPGNPAGVTGLDAYASIYADSKKWLNQGWCDIFSPQLYWRISSTGQPYGALLNWWVSQNTLGRLVAPSNAVSNLVNGWPAQEIVDQINLTRANVGSKGNVHYSIKYFRDNTSSITTTLQSGVYANDCLIPAFTWLDNQAPPRPFVRMSQSGSTCTFNISQGSGEAAQWFAIYTRYGNTWTTEVIPAATPVFSRATSNANGKLYTVYVSAVDRNGIESGKRKVAFLDLHDDD